MYKKKISLFLSISCFLLSLNFLNAGNSNNEIKYLVCYEENGEDRNEWFHPEDYNMNDSEWWESDIFKLMSNFKIGVPLIGLEASKNTFAVAFMKRFMTIDFARVIKHFEASLVEKTIGYRILLTGPSEEFFENQTTTLFEQVITKTRKPLRTGIGTGKAFLSYAARTFGMYMAFASMSGDIQNFIDFIKFCKGDAVDMYVFAGKIKNNSSKTVIVHIPYDNKLELKETEEEGITTGTIILSPGSEYNFCTYTGKSFKKDGGGIYKKSIQIPIGVRWYNEQKNIYGPEFLIPVTCSYNANTMYHAAWEYDTGFTYEIEWDGIDNSSVIAVDSGYDNFGGYDNPDPTPWEDTKLIREWDEDIDGAQIVIRDKNQNISLVEDNLKYYVFGISNNTDYDFTANISVDGVLGFGNLVMLQGDAPYYTTFALTHNDNYKEDKSEINLQSNKLSYVSGGLMCTQGIPYYEWPDNIRFKLKIIYNDSTCELEWKQDYRNGCEMIPKITYSEPRRFYIKFDPNGMNFDNSNSNFYKQPNGIISIHGIPNPTGDGTLLETNI